MSFHRSFYPKLASKVKHLGVMFDNEMAMATHISSLFKSLSFELRKVGSIRFSLSKEMATNL